MSEVSPSATVVLDGSGNGQCSIGPPAGTKWALRLATASIPAPKLQPLVQLYRGSASGPLELIDSSYTGANASSGKVAAAPFYPGQLLWAKWTGGDPGATATLQAYGRQGSRSDPFDLGPIGEGFTDPVVAQLIAGTPGGPRVVINATPIPAELVTYYQASVFAITNPETVIEVDQIFLGSGADYAYRVVLKDSSASPIPSLAEGIVLAGVVQETTRIRLRSVVPYGFETALTGALMWSNVIGSVAPDTVLFRASAQVLATDAIIYQAGGTVEGWHAAALQNLFTNKGAGFPALEYRRVPSPANEIEVVGTIVSGATTASGTVLANLPAGYRPISQQGHPATNFNTVALLPTTLDTSGDLKLWGVWANGHNIYVNSRYVLDL